MRYRRVNSRASWWSSSATASLSSVWGYGPALTGRGLGESFVGTCLRFAATTLGAQGYTLAVAAFNQRAITVYVRAGFRKVSAMSTSPMAGFTPSSGWHEARSTTRADYATRASRQTPKR